MKKEVKTPLGVKIISIYIFIVFIINLLTGFKLLTNIFNIFIFIFVALIIFSIIISLWKGNYKARTIILVLSFLGILNGVLNMISYPNDILTYGISFVILIPIIWYLMFNKEAKNFFKK